MTRSGFVALAGRPNVGKSTFVNAVVGEKVAIVSDRPQTTRRAIRGVHLSGASQIVLVDLPGVQRPRDALTSRMAKRVQQELEGSDAALLMINGEQGVGPGDRFIARTLVEARVPVTIAVNKVDRLAAARSWRSSRRRRSLTPAPRSSRSPPVAEPASQHWWSISPRRCRRARSCSARGRRPTSPRRSCSPS